ncbi:MAG: ribonuclease D [Thiotrichaceae bacterium]|nr:ribonuclease D [Thiotrichaceae bacterium]
MYDYIDTQEQLTLFVKKALQYDWIAIDTEFIREKTYFSDLSLIQIATESQLACIDPLAIDDISVLKDLLLNPKITKVLHAAHQDQEIFYNIFGEVPAPIFDTQPAAAVLGIGEQVGYAKLIENILGISLEKTQSRTDWTRRPLSAKQLDYAIDDVRYLREAYPLIIAKLKQQQRLDWLSADFEYYTQAETFDPKPQLMWHKVKGHQRLKPRTLTIVRDLAAWREHQAIKSNRPRRWIMSDNVIIDLAIQQPNSVDDIKTMRGANKQHQHHAATWFAMIQSVNAMKENELLTLPKFTKVSKSQATVIDLLMVAVKEQARIHQISPALITSRKKLEKMLLDKETQLPNDWRGKLVNQTLSDLLQGKKHFSIENQSTVRIK